MNRLKRVGIGLAVVAAGVGVGVGAAYAAQKLYPELATGGGLRAERLQFVRTGKILAPMTFSDGRLAGYVSFETELEVPLLEAAKVRREIPVLLHAINLRTYKTPLASGKDGLIPELEAFRRVVADAGAEVYGAKTVRRVVVTQAEPL